MELFRENEALVIVVETDYSRVIYFLFQKEGIYLFQNHTLIGFVPVTPIAFQLFPNSK